MIMHRHTERRVFCLLKLYPKYPKKAYRVYRHYLTVGPGEALKAIEAEEEVQPHTIFALYIFELVCDVVVDIHARFVVYAMLILLLYSLDRSPSPLFVHPWGACEALAYVLGQRHINDLLLPLVVGLQS